MTNFASGHLAEKYACQYLRSNGYKIIDVNWKTKYCEIDVVAQKSKIIHFIEVKYRSTDLQGTGFEYIIASKLKRMRFAAESWISNHYWEGEYVLSAIELGGPNYRVTGFLAVLE